MRSMYMRKPLVFMILIQFMLTAEAHAQSSQYQRPSKSTKATSNTKTSPSSTTKKGGDKNKDLKLDLSDIEKKYWAPKDTDFSVVQSRTYSKTKRYSTSLLAGPMINDSYSSGLNLNLSVNYFFNERSGVELSYTKSNLSDNETVTAFLNDVGGTGGVKPDHSKISSFYGASYNWVPFYAKMSVLGKKIIYFDMAISPGLGLITYDQQQNALGAKSKTAIAYTLDITQYYFLNKTFAIRADFKNKWFSEDVIKFSTTGSGAEGTHLRNQFVNTQTFLIGVTYYFK